MQYQTNYPYATTSQQYGGGSHAREEQRRRQQEYSQALAKQVAQREEQKRREREMDQQYARRNSRFQNPPQQAFRQTHQEPSQPPEGGILGGLGHNNPQNSRTSFARGQPQLHHRLPGPEPLDYSQPNSFQPRRVSYAGQTILQPPVDNQAFQGGFGFPVGPNQQQQHQPMQHQNWQQQPAHNDPHFVPGPGNMQTGWPQQNPQQRSMSQMRNSQFWPGQGAAEQAPPPVAYGNYGSPQRFPQNNTHPQAEPPGHSQVHNGGRRQQPDIHIGGRDNSEENEKRRKLQQQQEMQQALERQIEEKRQQKLEAKRRQEEEDRREMERFEGEQRQQRAEKERLQEEKRRKAELVQQKADQAAAAVAAANQQAKLQQQQKLHAQISQAQLQHPQSFEQQQQQHQFKPQLQQPEHFMNAPAPSRLKNPFTNSRAHLFEDPPSPVSPQRGPMPPNIQFGFSNQNASPVRGAPQSFGHAFQHENNAVGPSVDPVELRRQYDDMREELRRQKQLVDQLRQAQAQIQQQQQQRSPVRAESENIPTLMDLEKLRNELRGELEYREQLHRQELASLKREQQERSPEHSPRRYPGIKNSLELPAKTAPSDINHASHHRLAGHEANNSHEPQISQVRNKHLKHLDEAPINESLMSLRGESKFVYFDDRVAEDKKKTLSGVIRREEVLEEEQEEEILDEQRESPQIRHSLVKPLGLKSSAGETASSSLSKRKENQEDVDTNSEDDDHEFVVARTDTSPPHSDRYSQLPKTLTSSSPTKNYGKWRLESMGTNEASDSDDDLDASLDGEQLEALFQRNVRRHEILLGFQNKVHQDSNQLKVDGTPHSKTAWAKLHQQLESNRRTSIAQQREFCTSSSSSSNDSNHEQTIDPDDEAALVASSRWMPSSLLLLPKEQETRKTSVVNK